MKNKNVQKSNNEQTNRSATSMIVTYVLLSQKVKSTTLAGFASPRRGPVLRKFQIFARIHFESHRDFSKEPGIISLCLTRNISVRGPVEFFLLNFLTSSCSVEFQTTATIEPSIISTQADIICFPSYSDKPFFHSASHAV